MLINEACVAGSHTSAACEVAGIAIITYNRWSREEGLIDKRTKLQHVPKNKLSDDEYQEILDLVNSPEYCDLSPNKIVPILADKNKYIASESTIYRILRNEKLLKHRGRSRAPSNRRPEQHIAHKANQVWTWDISYLPSNINGLYFYLYAIIDVYSRKIVGFDVYERESAAEAVNIITQAYLDEKIMHQALILHSDNGSPMRGTHTLCAMKNLGIKHLFSRPSVSNDNPYSESFFKTLKYDLTYPVKFESLAAARAWCISFIDKYNNRDLHSSLKYVTPQQRHDNTDILVKSNRTALYHAARKKHPERWMNKIRDWYISETETLNAHRKKHITTPA